MALVVLLVSGTLCSGDVRSAERARPIRIGALTNSWGPTPTIVGLRDGLLALGYREPEQFVLGVRFTQEDQTALPAAAHQLVEQAVQAPAEIPVEVISQTEFVINLKVAKALELTIAPELLYRADRLVR